MDDRITLTTVQDLANIVVKAVEYEREWPLYGGIRGDNMTVRELIQIGESVRGKLLSRSGPLRHLADVSQANPSPSKGSAVRISNLKMHCALGYR